MKKFKDKKYFRPAVIAGAIAVVLGVLHLLGFRITFIEPNWDAISAWAAWVGVAASFIAIWFTIQIPKKIADRQDKIALFGKRFECYMIIQNFLGLSTYLENVNNANRVLCCYQVILNGKLGVREKITNESTLADMNRAESILISGGFLFSTYDVQLWENVLDALSQLMVSLDRRSPHLPDEQLTDDELVYKNKFCHLCKKFEEEYLEGLEQEMDLKKN